MSGTPRYRRDGVSAAIGNELIAIKMEVNDVKMKWLVVGIGALVGLGYAVSSFGPSLMYTFGAM